MFLETGIDPKMNQTSHFPGWPAVDQPRFHDIDGFGSIPRLSTAQFLCDALFLEWKNICMYLPNDPCMVCITYIYTINNPNVGKYTMYGQSCLCFF